MSWHTSDTFLSFFSLNNISWRLLHRSICIPHSFLQLHELQDSPLYGCLFNHSSTDGHLVCFILLLLQIIWQLLYMYMVHMCLLYISSLKFPVYFSGRSKISGTKDKCICNFGRYCQISLLVSFCIVSAIYETAHFLIAFMRKYVVEVLYMCQ